MAEINVSDDAGSEDDAFIPMSQEDQIKRVRATDNGPTDPHERLKLGRNYGRANADGVYGAPAGDQAVSDWESEGGK